MGPQISTFIMHPDFVDLPRAQFLSNTNYETKTEIAQIRPYNTYMGVNKK